MTMKENAHLQDPSVSMTRRHQSGSLLSPVPTHLWW